MPVYVDLGRTEILPPNNPVSDGPPHFVDTLLNEIYRGYAVYDQRITSADPEQNELGQSSDMGALVEARGQVVTDYLINTDKSHPMGALNEARRLENVTRYTRALTVIASELAQAGTSLFRAEVLVGDDGSPTISRTLAARSITALICAEECARYSQMEVRHGWLEERFSRLLRFDQMDKRDPAIYRFGPMAVSYADWKARPAKPRRPLAYYREYEAINKINRRVNQTLEQLFEAAMHYNLLSDLESDGSVPNVTPVQLEGAPFDLNCRPIIGELIAKQVKRERRVSLTATEQRAAMLTERRQRIAGHNPLSLFRKPSSENRAVSPATSPELPPASISPALPPAGASYQP